MYGTMAKILFGEASSIIVQNVILPPLYMQTWPSHKVSKNKEFLSGCFAFSTYSCCRDVSPEKTAFGS